MVRHPRFALRLAAFVACAAALACDSPFDVLGTKAVVDVTLTNGSAENVHIMLAGEVFNAGNRIAPASSIVRGIAMSRGEVLSFQAGRNVGLENEVFVELDCTVPEEIDLQGFKPQVVFDSFAGSHALACAW